MWTKDKSWSVEYFTWHEEHSGEVNDPWEAASEGFCEQYGGGKSVGSNTGGGTMHDDNPKSWMFSTEWYTGGANEGSVDRSVGYDDQV